jgi:hypothetical protein
MDMMRMQVGRRYQVQFPNGNMVTGEVRKIDNNSIILNSLLSSRIIQREDMKDTIIYEI